MSALLDKALEPWRALRIGQTVVVTCGKRRGQKGEIVEQLDPPTLSNAYTGLARYGVRIDRLVTDYSRCELRPLKLRKRGGAS